MPLPDRPSHSIRIFYSYSHKDEKLRNKLETQLALLKRQGYVSEWHDRIISPGIEWAKEIDSFLQTADIILLLVSPDFIASDYCYSIEVDQAMKMHEAGKACVIPVILRPVSWHETPFGKLQALPSDGKPITSRVWHNQDEAFFAVAEGIRKTVKEMSAHYSEAKDTSKHIAAQVSHRERDIIASHNKDKLFATSSTVYSPQFIEEQNQRAVRILIIDDEEHIIEFIRLGLRYEGFQVESALDGEQGITVTQRLNPDLIILDVNLPGIDGLEVCRRLRSNPMTNNIPILMLTAKDELYDKILGLRSGADDYLTKPFNFDELLERVRAILRHEERARSRQSNTRENEERILQVADLRLDTTTREVTRSGRQIELTTTEYNLLHLFMRHPRQVLDRQTILNRVWGYDFLGETNIIEVYVRYLREKLEDDPTHPRLLQTVRSVGYVLKG